MTNTLPIYGLLVKAFMMRPPFFCGYASVPIHIPAVILELLVEKKKDDVGICKSSHGGGPE